jgi:uncharacterized membrane protein
VTAAPKAQSPWRHAIRPFTARPYLLIAAVVAVVAFLIAGLTHLAALTRGLIGWDLGVVSFLALTFRSMIKVDLEQMKQRAADVDQEENHLNGLVCSGQISLAEAQRRESALKHTEG